MAQKGGVGMTKKRRIRVGTYQKVLDEQVRIMVNHIVTLRVPVQTAEMNQIYDYLKHLEKMRKAASNMKPTDRLMYDIFQSKLNRYVEPVQILEYDDGNGY